MSNKLKQLLPSLARGVYRFNLQLGEYLEDGDYEGFVQAKLAFLPHPHQSVIKELVGTFDYSNHSVKAPKANAQIANDYFASHPYLAEENNKNYLEREFVRKVLTNLLVAQGLDLVYPQRSVGNFRLDFAIIGQSRYAIELDGFEKFGKVSDLEAFSSRQNYIMAEDWRVFRYSYASVVNNTVATIDELKQLFSNDKVLSPYLKSYQQQHHQQLLDEAPDPVCSLCSIVDYFFAIQDCFVNYLVDNKPHKKPMAVKINEALNLDFSLAALALSDLYYYLEEIKALFEDEEIQIDLPKIYLDQKLSTKIKTVGQALHAKIKWGKYTDAQEITLNEHELQQTIFSIRNSLFPLASLSFRPVTAQYTKQTIQTKLAYFAKSIFGYDEGIRYKQVEIFAKIFEKQDVLGLLPTGSGKSFCFWLPAILKPGLTLVICPLKSLMRDQMLSLKGFGIHSAAFINADIKEFERQAIYTDIKLGHIRLLYISPERMQIKRFLDELAEIMTLVPINFLVIDEAHCVSEWGHDFRPSYLRIPTFRNLLQKIYPEMTTIALTATAGELVKKDMINVLRLSESNIVSADNFNRHNLSFQFITVNSYKEKAKQFKQVIDEYLPTALKKKSIKQIFAPGAKTDKGVGLIFCIYADARGKFTTKDAVGHYLRSCQSLIENNHESQREDFGEGAIRGFSSTKPTLCPNCFSSKYINIKYIDQQAPALLNYICTQCNTHFNKNNAVSPPSWEKLLRRNQEDFKAGKIDLMVTTKGFGMGIDKGSVRFVVHTSMAGGMESWYQEAGRAGRDGSHAHCISIVDVPTQACLDALTKSNEIPDCSQTSCPHGKEAICDYGKQHVFIAKSYPSIPADTLAILRCLDDLIEKSTNGQTNLLLKTSKDYQNNLELALFRLLTLGIIEDYTLDYKEGVTIEVVGFTANISAEQIKSKLRDYLNTHDIKNNELKTDKEIDQLLADAKLKYQDEVENRIEKEQKKNLRFQRYTQPDLITMCNGGNDDYYDFYQLIMNCAFVMLEHVYEDVRGMRYEALKKLRDVFIIHPDATNRCRRYWVLEYFQSEISEKSQSTIIKNNYKCGFCDTCQPDLLFQKEQSQPLEFADDLAEIDMQFRDWLTNDELFELDKGEFFIRAFQDYPINAFSKATYILVNSNPRNLKALFIARHFSGPDEKLKYSRRLLETANSRKKLSLDTICSIYETTDDSLKPDVFSAMLDTIGRLLNDVDGEQWLYEKAQALKAQGNIDPDVVKLLAFRVFANQLPSIPLSEYQQELNRLLGR